MAAAIVVVLVLVGAAAGGGYLWWQNRPGTDGPEHPKQWDARVVDLVEVVERERGVAFAHPVKVSFLAPAEFKKRFALDELDAEAKEEIEQAVGLLRALGLLSGEVDLVGDIETMTQEGVIGYYDPETDELVVRGTELSPGVKATLVHELTHALDDQYFDLEELQDESGPDDGGGMPRSALIEASAMRVEDAYVASLSPEDQEAVERESDFGDDGAREKFDSLPDVLTELFAMPYVLGPAFLNVVVGDATGKEAATAIDIAFRNPPATEEELARPARYASRDAVRKVPAPKLAAGEKRRGEPESFGVIGLLLTLAPHVGFDAAYQATSGWAGDRMVLFTKAGKTCVRSAFAFDDGPTRDAFVAAGSQWASAQPSASVRPVGADGAQLDACDPGTGGPEVKAAVPAVSEGLGVRNVVLGELVKGGLDEMVAGCVVDDVVRQLGSARFVEVASQLDESPEDAGLGREIQRAFEGAATTCGVRPPG